MIGNLETSLSSLQTHGMMAQAQQALTGPLGEAGRLPVSRDAVPPIDRTPSLTLNADALKAQEAALSLLDRVFAAANTVFQQVAPLWESRSAAEPLGEGENLADYRIRDLLQNTRFEGAPLFDLGRVNAQTLGELLRQAPETSRIELFSPEVRSQITEAFDQAFDLYA